MFVLSKKDLDVILNNFPYVKENVTSIADEMKENFDEQNLPGKCVPGFDVQEFDSEIRKKVIFLLTEESSNNLR